MRQFTRLPLLLALCVYLLSAPASAARHPWLGESYDTAVAEEWMNVLLGGRKIGFSYHKIEKGENGYRITGRAVMRLSVMGMTQDLSFSQSFYLDSAKNVLGFVSLKKIQDQRMQTVGTVKGDVIELEIRGAGGTSKAEARIKPGTRFLETLGFTMSDELAAGLRKAVPVYIIELRAPETVLVEVAGKETIKTGSGEIEVFAVDFTIQGFKTRSYMTKDGVIVREEETMMGIVSERVSEKEALAFAEGPVPITSLITFSLIKADKAIPDPAQLKEMRFEISGIDDPAAIPADGRQLKESTSWETGADGKRTARVPVITSVESPPGGVTIAEASRAEPEFVKPSPEAQSDNKMIQKTARDIIGAETDAWAAARGINRWVYENIEKELVDSFTAVDVLLSKKGECQSHTNLYVALARSVGIPARVASGLVYSPKNEGFLYHAWPEVYAGEWVAVDPTLGQDIADVTHIKLAEGGLENQINLVRFLGRIKVSVKSFE